MSKYLTPEIEPNELGLKLKSKADFSELEKQEEIPTPIEEIVEEIPEIEKENIIPEKIPKIEKEEKEVKSTSTIRQIIDFILLSSIIFIAIFLTVNFSAYKQIIFNYLYPEQKIEQSENLNKIVDQVAKKQILLSVDPSKKLIKKSFPPLDISITPPDNRIVIPKLGQNVPLVEMDANNLQGENWSELEKQIQDGLREGVVHYPGTAIPGQVGNVFMTGHSSYYPWDKGLYKEVFALLPKLEIGDIYHVFYNQKQYTYRIREKKEVYPNNVQVLNQPVDEQISTLMTCVPIGTALRRLIIIAEQI